MSEKQLKELTDRLDALIKLTAMNALQGKSLQEQVGVLSEFGLQPTEIASILGTTPGYVNVAKGRLKKKRRKPKGKQAKSAKKGGKSSGTNR